MHCRSVLLLLFAACFVTLAGTAQTASTAKIPAQKPPQSVAQSTNAKPVPGKMRGTTMEMRQAAAVRSADRKARRATTVGPSTTVRTEVK